MGIYIHDLIFGIEQRMFWKRRIIEDADVDCRLCINVFFAMFKAVIHTAEISNGTFWPVVVIVFLHFQVYLLMAI